MSAAEVADTRLSAGRKADALRAGIALLALVQDAATLDLAVTPYTGGLDVSVAVERWDVPARERETQVLSSLMVISDILGRRPVIRRESEDALTLEISTVLFDTTVEIWARFTTPEVMASARWVLETATVAL
ncbi:hypothetical protein [Parafrankia sp. FMc2]|uniref:hypothetical protein n=1 Tax=Parafrankia sp. FMc2 TaxID=3233196 RepID=UPI0034D6378E